MSKDKDVTVVAAKFLECVELVYPRDKQAKLLEYLSGSGWRVLWAVDEGKTHRKLCVVREDTVHSAQELRDEVAFDVKKI